MADVTQEQVVDFLSNLPVMDLRGAHQGARGQVGRQGGSGGGRGGRRRPRRRRGAAAEEKTEFTVVLNGAGAKKIKRHQGGPRDHRPRPQGGQGPRRRRAEDRQGRRLQGRGRGRSRRSSKRPARRSSSSSSTSIAVVERRRRRRASASRGSRRASRARRRSATDSRLEPFVARSIAGGARWRHVIQNNFRVRKNFAKIEKIIEIPNLIDIQKRVYDKFLQTDVPPEKREDIGLQGVFKSRLPDQGLQRRRRRSSSSATTSRSRSTTSTSAASAA